MPPERDREKYTAAVVHFENGRMETVGKNEEVEGQLQE